MRSSIHALQDAAGCRPESSPGDHRFTNTTQPGYKRMRLLAGAIVTVVFLISWSFTVAAYAQNTKRGSDKAGGRESTHASDKSDATSHEPADPLGRDSPHGTLLGFLHAAQNGNYKQASQYLQLSTTERVNKGEVLAHKLHHLMDRVFVGRIGAVSDNPEGSPQPGVPHDHERIGVFRVNDGETGVDLVRVADPETGENIWLFSSDTLAAVRNLSGQLEESKLESKLPRFLVAEEIFSTPLWRWIAFLLLIPVALLLSSAMVALLRGGLGVWLRRRPRPVLRDLRDTVKGPAKLIFTVGFHWLGVFFLGLPLLMREYYRRFAGVALAAGLTWVIVRLIHRWAERARLNTLADSGFRSGSIILLGQRILTVVVIIVAVLVMLSIFGFDMTTAVAGLGIGSIAIAFAAQKTLENLLGGISILGDQVIRVGERCRIGDEVGIIQDISLRSTRIRTVDSTELSVPNGQLANMNIENLSRYDRNSFRTTIGLQHGTSPDQLRSLLQKIGVLLRSDPRVDPDVARVRLIGFGESSLDIGIYCHVLTGDWNEFLAIREDLLLRIMDLIAEAGTQLALPSRTLHLAQPEALGDKRPHVTEPQAFKRRQSS